MLIEVVRATGARRRCRVRGLVSISLVADDLLQYQFVPVDSRRRAQRLSLCRPQRRAARRQAVRRLPRRLLDTARYVQCSTVVSGHVVSQDQNTGPFFIHFLQLFKIYSETSDVQEIEL